MRLDQCWTGQRLVVQSVEDGLVRDMAVRIGLGAGVEVTCQTKLPLGPVVLTWGDQEIAVGRGIARRIMVRVQRGRRGEAGEP
ncbi:MAG TPA: ferrous iron transport protein A [Bacillota bacterium]|nr:ferrous iron transport protein A [Bacillota bacterium]